VQVAQNQLCFEDIGRWFPTNHARQLSEIDFLFKVEGGVWKQVSDYISAGP